MTDDTQEQFSQSRSAGVEMLGKNFCRPVRQTRCREGDMTVMERTVERYRRLASHNTLNLAHAVGR
jgi:hypothetical protein